MDANRVRGRKGSTPDAAFRTLWSPPICTVCESRTLTLRRNGGCFDHTVPKKDVRLNIRPRERAKLLWFASFFHHTEKRKRFCSGVFKNISPIYGHGRGQKLGAFQKRFWKLIFCLTEKHGPFWPVFFKLFLHSPLYGEKHAVLIRCFPKTFSASSTIRRNACPFVNVFPRKDLLLWYTATGMDKT